MQKISKLNTLFLTAICFFAFLIFGFTDNLKGSTLPPMMAELNIDYGTGGNIFFGQYLGFLIATLITGILADKFGLKLVIVLAGLLLAIGAGGYSAFSTATLLAISMFVIGLGLGAFELGPNAIIVSLYHEQKGFYLNLMAVMHGLGSMIAPLIAGWLFTLGGVWRDLYRWDVLLVSVLILFSLLLRFPEQEGKSSLDFRAVPRVAFKGLLPLFYTVMALYVAGEIGLASWLVVYLQDVRGASVTASNQALALFFGVLMFGRLIGSFIVHRLGYLRTIFIASLFAVLSLSLGIFTSLTILIPFTGFFFSIIFPTLTAAVSDIKHENLNTVLGVLFTFSGIGGMIGPWLVAWGGDLLGLKIGFLFVLILVALTSFFAYILYQKVKHEKNP